MVTTLDELFKMKKIVLLAFVSVLLSTAVVVRFTRQVVADGTIYIRADGSVEGTDKIQRDGNVYTFTDNIYDSIVVERDNIVIDGARYIVQGTGAWNSTGIDLSGRSNVTIKNMEVKAFWDGIVLWNSLNNRIYHNNFINNTNQVYSSVSVNIWDDGYPSGGNYWSDYIDVDQYSGPYQNEPGSDGIWDHPYVIDENNQDNYPIVARGRVYDGIYFPLGDKSFADEVVDFKPGKNTVSPYNNPQSAVGPPDWPSPDDENYVALGHGGILTVEFTDNYLIDVDGADLYVFEIGGSVEPFKVEISEDGSNWIDLGTVRGQPTSLDIHSKVAPNDEFRYVRITDANSYMSPYPVAGADIDAVGAIGARAIAPNNPPYQPQLSITPSLAVEDADDLIVTVIGPTPTDPDGDAVTYAYRWLVDVGTEEFLDDEVADRGDHTENTVPAADTVVGDVWRVEVTPIDEHGAVGPNAIATWQVVVDATKPVADAGPDQTVVEDIVVSFDAEGSSDNVGIVSYGWDFGDGTTRTGLTVNHTYAEPGTYNVTLTVTDATGYEDTHSITITVLPTEPIREPRSVHVVAAVAVVAAAVTATTAALASLGGLGQSFNSAVSKLPIPKPLKDFLKIYGKALFKTVDKAKLEALEKAPFITRGDLAALGISALVMTIVFGFVEANGLPRFLNPSVLAAVIPSTLLSACMVRIVKEFSGVLCARTCGIYRQFNLWMYGLVVFLISGLLFLFPFGTPVITRYQSGEISNKTKGLIVLSEMLVLLTLTIPFAGLSMLGFKIIGGVGLSMTLMIVCYSLVPLKPLAGKAIFDYRKEVSLIAFALTAILFYSFSFKLLPNVTYLAVGVVSVFLAAITLSQLRKAHPK